MSTATNIYGGLGSLSQPPPRTKGMYAIGVRKPGSEREPNVPFMFATNGDITLKDPIDAKKNKYIASAIVPVITTPLPGSSEANFAYRYAIDAFLAEPGSALWKNTPYNEDPNIHKLMKFDTGVTGLERNLRGLKSSDILNKTWPYYPGEGFLAFENDEFSHILTEDYAFDTVIDYMQLWATELLTTTRPPITTWWPLGWGVYSLGQKPALLRSPGVTSKYLGKYKLEHSFPYITAQARDMAYYNFWLELYAAQLEKMFPIANTAREDSMAIAWQLLYQEVSVGKNARPTDKWPQNAQDIKATILNQIGANSNRAWSFRWRSMKQVEESLELALIRGFVHARAKPETFDMDMHLIDGDKTTAVEDLRRIWHADYDAFGSDSTPWWTPARTFAENDYFLPAMMVDDMTNEWTRNPPITGDSFKSATVENSEIGSEVFNPKDNREDYIIYNLTPNDARKWVIEYKRHTAIVWKFRLHGFTNTVISDEGISVQQLMAMLSGAPSVYKRAYVVNAAFGVVDDPGFVNIAHQEVPGLTGLVVTKEDKETNAKGIQMMAPGASIQASPEKTNVPQVIPQPSIQPQAAPSTKEDSQA